MLRVIQKASRGIGALGLEETRTCPGEPDTASVLDKPKAEKSKHRAAVGNPLQ